MRNMLIPFFLIAGSSFAALHIIASGLYLYWRYEWLDIVMHFYGGIVVVLGIFALASSGLFVKERWLKISVSLTVLLVFAIVWEVYEFVIGPLKQDNYVLDTIIDLVMGASGAVVGHYLSAHFYHSKI